jgi:Multidrug resistance efflux pump
MPGVSELLVQEGDAVRKGQVVARIDAVRYQDAVNRAQAALLAQQNVLAKLKAGSRPQEIAEARAGVDAALAAQANAKATLLGKRRWWNLASCPGKVWTMSPSSSTRRPPVCSARARR